MDGNLYRTSLHEAGHLIVGKVLGRQGVLYLWRRSVSAPWHGRVRFDEPLQDWPDDERILVALAGAVCEEVVYSAPHGMSAGAMFQECNSQRRTFSNMILSSADLVLAEGFDLHHIERTYEVVGAQDEAIRQAAAEARTRALETRDGLGISPP